MGDLSAPTTLLIPHFEATFNPDGTILSAGLAARDTQVTIYNDAHQSVVADIGFYSEQAMGHLVHDFTLNLRGSDRQVFSVAQMLRGDPRALPCSHHPEFPRIGATEPYSVTYLFQTLGLLDSTPRAVNDFQVTGVITNPIHGYMTVSPVEGSQASTRIRAEYAIGKPQEGKPVQFGPPSTAPEETVCLLIGSLITPTDRTAEGRLIEVVGPAWLEIIELLARRPVAAYEIPPRRWEEIVAAAYKRAGFDEVTLTPHSGDSGRDVIAVKHGLGRVRVIDQVKAYKPGHLVTADDVRALMGVLQTDGASKGFLTTTSDFAPRLRDDPLIRPFMPSRLELIDGRALLERLRQLGSKGRSWG